MTTHSLTLSPPKVFTIMTDSPSLQFRKTLQSLNKSGCLFAVIGVPWDLMLQHEDQCQRNHSQSVQRLHERGGLDACEAVAALEDREWRRMDDADAHKRLFEIVNEYTQGHNHENA